MNKRAKPIKIVIDDACKQAEASLDEWAASLEKTIDGRIRKMLDDRLESIVCQLLGFEKGWGEWKVDHCNGRAGNSAAGDYIRKKAGEGVNTWLDEQAGKLPKLHSNAIKSLHEEYKSQLHYKVRDLLSARAAEEAKKIVADRIEKILGATNA